MNSNDLLDKYGSHAYSACAWQGSDTEPVVLLALQINVHNAVVVSYDQGTNETNGSGHRWNQHRLLFDALFYYHCIRT
jgi:hypothetical protein